MPPESQQPETSPREQVRQCIKSCYERAIADRSTHTRNAVHSSLQRRSQNKSDRRPRGSRRRSPVPKSSVDIHALEAAYEAVSQLSPNASTAEVTTALVENPVMTREVRQALGRVLKFPDMDISDDGIRKYHSTNALAAIDEESFRTGGKDFLRDLLDSRYHPDFAAMATEESLHAIACAHIDQETNNRLAALRQEARHVFGQEHLKNIREIYTAEDLKRYEVELGHMSEKNCADMIDLLFFLLGGNIELLENIVKKQITLYKDALTIGKTSVDFRTNPRPDEAIPPILHFFYDVRKFLSTYFDVSRGIHSEMKDSGQTELIRGSQNFLMKLLEECSHQIIHGHSNTKSLFGLDTTELKKGSHPWFSCYSKQTVFTHKNLDLMTPEMPRVAVSTLMVALNKHMEIEELAYTLNQVDRIQRSKIPMPQKIEQLTKLLGVTRLPSGKFPLGNIEQYVAHIEKIIPEKERQLRELEEKYEMKAGEIPDKTFTAENGSSVHLAEVFLRILDPRKICQSEQWQRSFLNMMESLSRENIKSPILYASIRSLLHSNNRALDIPLVGLGRRSIRSHVMELGRKAFDETSRRRGLEVEATDQEARKIEGPLFGLPDALPPQAREKLSRKFNVAALQEQDPFLAGIYSEMKELFSFEELMEFSREMCADYLQTDNHDMYFFPSATDGFTAVIAHLQAQGFLNQGDAIGASDQEYESITEAAGKNVRVETFSFYNAEGGRPYTVEEMFENINSLITKKNLKMIILSPKTRFGDAPCAEPDRNNIPNLGRLNRMIEEHHPGVLLVSDACQGIGRSIADNLGELNSHIYLWSGKKALEAGTVGGVAWRKDADQIVSRNSRNMAQASSQLVHAFEQALPGQNPSADLQALLRVLGPHVEKLKEMIPEETVDDYFGAHYDYGTKVIENIVAMALRFHMLQSPDDLIRAKGNEGELTEMRCDEKHTLHLQRLTKYTIAKVEKYYKFLWGHLLKRHQGACYQYGNGDNYTGAEKLATWLCPRITQPTHRSEENYNGMVTITFPCLSGNQLAGGTRARTLAGNNLAAHGIEVLGEGSDIRVSFRYEHDQRHIDVLFETIQKIHTEYLREQLSARGKSNALVSQAQGEYDQQPEGMRRVLQAQRKGRIPKKERTSSSISEAAMAPLPNDKGEIPKPTGRLSRSRQERRRIRRANRRRKKYG